MLKNKIKMSMTECKKYLNNFSLQLGNHGDKDICTIHLYFDNYNYNHVCSVYTHLHLRNKKNSFSRSRTFSFIEHKIKIMEITQLL